MLTPSQLKLISTFNALNQNITMSTFNDRMEFQKKVYLIQEFGVPLGYSFGWYMRGPYSSSAADDGFKLGAIQNQVRGPSLSLEENEALERYKEIIEAAEEAFSSLDEPYILELVASLHFIMNRGYPRPSNDHEAVQMLIDRKPRFRNLEGNIVHFLETTNLRN